MMFVRTEWLSERRCLVGTRRVRSPGDPSACAAQWLDVEGGGDEPQRETDRARFIGRGHDQRDPVALAGELSGTVGTVHDPIFSLRRRVRIAPGATVVLQLWTVAAGTREETLALADRFRDAGAFASASESTLQRSQETRSEEQTSELQSIMRISYAVFGLKKKTTSKQKNVIKSK